MNKAAIALLVLAVTAFTAEASKFVGAALAYLPLRLCQPLRSTSSSSLPQA